jgi:hypothetical protein
MVLLWTPSGTSLKPHIANVHGAGGTIKRLARKASLQNPYEEQIMTPRQL